MAGRLTLGVDIGTSSSKGVVVDEAGEVRATAVREHRVDSPAPGHFEMQVSTWTRELTEISRECIRMVGGGADIGAVGISGMGPCLAVTDADDTPLRPAILYGIDTRAGAEIQELTRALGADEIQLRTGSALSTQAVGPKLAWLAKHEPAVFERSRRMFMPSSWLVAHLTGEYVLDHHSASQCNPLYDLRARQWYRPWVDQVSPDLELPHLLWPGERAGTVTARAAASTGLPAGIPVTAGTIDAWAEAVSVDAQHAGDLMLMYGTTMFLIATANAPVAAAGLWGTNGALPGTYSLAGGMATSGAITGWLRELFGGPSYADLLAEAQAAGVGSGGVLMLPYFAGERTPFADPAARGVVVGLTTATTRGDLYRAALEATAFGVRHNVEAFAAAGNEITRVVAVGGGTQGQLWTQIVSDVTGLEQEVHRTTIGASYGSAYLAAGLIGDPDIARWNPVAAMRRPDPEAAPRYDALYQRYRELYPATKEVVHALVDGA